ncbi:hypothetical protein AQUCO_11400028v1 [Aquilegia coerulea]|uniref:Uncharacterized protein n=1 Tax=Aquilegia coerulea TaxID=218851 RepID=A0A2G5C2G5_AQUCA|nr:hypothetical protein AQUCO_11400028v1 [Aquilegia coerulea]
MMLLWPNMVNLNFSIDKKLNFTQLISSAGWWASLPSTMYRHQSLAKNSGKIYTSGAWVMGCFQHQALGYGLLLAPRSKGALWWHWQHSDHKREIFQETSIIVGDHVQHDTEEKGLDRMC